jgi:hypothetical protein
MKYKSSRGNIFSSNNIDPDFIEYLYGLPAEFLDEMFMAWVMMKNKQNKPIKSKEIYNLSKTLSEKNIDFTEIFKDQL